MNKLELKTKEDFKAAVKEYDSLTARDSENWLRLYELALAIRKYKLLRKFKDFYYVDTNKFNHVYTKVRLKKFTMEEIIDMLDFLVSDFSNIEYAKSEGDWWAAKYEAKYYDKDLSSPSVIKDLYYEIQYVSLNKEKANGLRIFFERHNLSIDQLSDQAKAFIAKDKECLSESFEKEISFYSCRKAYSDWRDEDTKRMKQDFIHPRQ